MLRNYLKVALRTLRRRPLYTSINVLGLAVGMAVCILIGLYVRDELSYDDFHENAERIYQIGHESTWGRGPSVPYPLADLLEQEVPGVEEAVRTWGGAARVIRPGRAEEGVSLKVLTAGEGFFRLFSFPFVRGDSSAAPSGPNRAVISEEAASRLFGEAHPIGRTIRFEYFDEERELAVEAVVEDPPRSSTIEFDVVVPFSLVPEQYTTENGWGASMYRTYALMQERISTAELDRRVRSAVGDAIGTDRSLFSVPLTEVYLSDLYQADGFRGQSRYIYIFGTMALLILAMAVINYVNMVVARAEERAQEVGVRRGIIVLQFAISIALILGTVVVHEQLGFMQERHLSLEGDQVAILRLTTDRAERLADRMKERMLRHSFVRSATVTTAEPADFGISFADSPDDFSNEAETDRTSITFHPARVDADYLETVGLELVAGRNFSEERPADEKRAYVLNETAVERMGWTPEGAIGRPFALGSRAPAGTVIGVVEDFPIASLREPIEPVALQMTSYGWSANSMLLVRARAGAAQSVVEEMRTVLDEFAPGVPVRYPFLDEKFEELYRAEIRLRDVASTFAALAVLIACLGLFALAAYATSRRTKEIGVRKVLGATVSQIVALLSGDFLKLVLAGLLVGAPLAYLAMQQWLRDFAYRTDLGPFLFLGVGVLAIAISFLAVSYHTIRAAVLDPAQTLRYE